MITLITPTGDRVDAFALTRKWMDRQTEKCFQWIVIDDGVIPVPKELLYNTLYIRVLLGNNGHTLTRNLRMALPYIIGDKILIIEDDDWYGPTYVKTMSKYLDKFNLVGEVAARYYHVPTMRYRRIGNITHASLCQTGFRREILPIFEQCLAGDPYVDARLWKAVTSSKFLIRNLSDNKNMHCSMKGLRGRKGIGTGHDPNAAYYLPDSHLSMLRQWVGEEDARIYMDHVGQNYESALLIGENRSPLIKKGVGSVKGKRSVLPFIPIVKADPFGISVVTCTGDRPEAFNLCKLWVSRQTMKPNQWIVVDDGKTPIEPPPSCDYIRRIPTSKDCKHTMCHNLMLGLSHVRFGKVIIMEDDDWYASNYIEFMASLLDKADLVGIGNLIFYHVKQREYMEKQMAKQPPFYQTGFHDYMIPTIMSICEKAPLDPLLRDRGLVDVKLWGKKHVYSRMVKKYKMLSVLVSGSVKYEAGRIYTEKDLPSAVRAVLSRKGIVESYSEYEEKSANPLVFYYSKYLSIGIKGLPGRKGLTMAQNSANRRYNRDGDCTILSKYVGDDVEYYREFFGGS